MKIFLDTANLEDIRKRLPTGLVDGVTSNPKYVALTGRPFKDVIAEISPIVPGPFSVEGKEMAYEPMVEEAHRLAGYGDNIVIKLPLTVDGLRAAPVLEREGVRVNVTVVASLNQALLAAKTGATFISVVVGWLDEVGEDGMATAVKVQEMIRRYGFKSKLICGAMRSPRHVSQAVENGIDVVTLSGELFDRLFENPVTDDGLRKFAAHWKNIRLS